VAGRIREEDIAEVREKARIDDVVSAYVTLRNAGGGNLKGLCPFHDEKSPSFNVTPARGMYHCLAGETEVLTWDGIKPIRELAGGTHRILNQSAGWVDAPFKSYGVQGLMKITLTRNRQRKEIFATDQHRWFIRAGKLGTQRHEKVTRDLRAGDRLCYTFPRNNSRHTTPSPFGVAHGFTYGDGSRLGKGSVALICPPKDEAMLKWFPNSVTTAKDDKGNLLVHHLPAFFKERPSLDESHSYLLGWLAGYFAADGCVASDGTVILNSAKRDDLDFVRTLCARLGIATYGITSQWREGFAGREPSELFCVHFVNADLTEDFFLIPKHRERFVGANKQFARRGWVVQAVEPTDRVEEVFCAEVEDGHAFTLADNILTGNCFGCGAGGDVIKFVMEMDGLSFSETVERLAERFGVQLRYEEGGPQRSSGGPQRPRLVEAHRVAADYYVDQLGSAEARAARQFLSERGFDQDAAQTFGVGFSPRGGEDLLRVLRQKDFSPQEMVASGLIGDSGRGPYDRFRGRLMWPIRDTSGDTIGFGARRIFDDDRIEAKYLNTPETVLYKKSQVLYGIDLARREIARSSQAVVVEGYTDVMACHLSGVKTAVATCGTAFGDDHGRVIRRLLQDHDEFRGEVIFTFDGDEAGQKAALRAFEGDQAFAGQTYVAIEPTGLDPCDLRLQHGEAEVRELVARRIPLYRFVLGSVVSRYDLDRADGRIDALREAAKLVSSIRDRSKVDAFSRELAGMVGIDPDDARREVRRASARASQPATSATVPPARPDGTAAAPAAAPLPDPRDPRLSIERETLKLAVQHPDLVSRWAGDRDADDFTHPAYRALWLLLAGRGFPAEPDPGWVGRLRGADPRLDDLLTALAVEQVKAPKEPGLGYVHQHVSRLQELTALRRIAELKSRLQRTNPVEQAADYNRMFGELVALEQHRRQLRELAVAPE
jgi:DNA primase